MHKDALFNIVVGGQRGFTLIEVLAVITVLVVLLGIGVPAFTETIRNNRATAQTNDFVTALSITRSEATKRGLPVSVCAANAAQNACAGAAMDHWANGWLIFTDRLGNPGEIDDDDEILQVSLPISNGLELTTNDVGFVRFGADGAPAPTPAADVTFDVVHAKCSGSNRRRITLDRFMGRLSTTKVSCS